MIPREILNLELSFDSYGRNLAKRATTSMTTFEMRFLHPAYPYRTRSFLLPRGSHETSAAYMRGNVQEILDVLYVT